jgi:hypothetical protein
LGDRLAGAGASYLTCGCHEGEHHDYGESSEYTFRENLKAQFRFEVFNLTNTPLFNGLNATYGSPEFWSDYESGESSQLCSWGAGVVSGGGYRGSTRCRCEKYSAPVFRFTT